MKRPRYLPSLAALLEAGRQWFSREPASPPPPVDPFAPPSDLRFECGRFPYFRAVRYRIRNGWVERTARQPLWTRADPALRRRRPTPEDWRDFWQTIEPLRIWEWQPMYFTPPPSHPFVLDGGSWRFSCRRGSLRVKSFGGSYYPKLWRPRETDSRHDAIALLRLALDRLLAPIGQNRVADPRNMLPEPRRRPHPPLREAEETERDQ